MDQDEQDAVNAQLEQSRQTMRAASETLAVAGAQLKAMEAELNLAHAWKSLPLLARLWHAFKAGR